MDIKNIPCICGGTFFTLLLGATKQGLNERQKWGESAEFTESDVFEFLIKVAVPTYERPADSENFKSVVSAYKACNASKSGRLPIHEQANISTFNNRVKVEYHVALSAMTTLVERYIDIEGKGLWLIRALLELIYEDENVKQADLLFICQDGSTIDKKNLLINQNICLPSFLLGIWHFIVIHEIDNGVGKATYDEWCKPGKSKNTREPFRSRIGENITQSLSVTMPMKQDETDVTADDEPSIYIGEPYEEPTRSNSDSDATTQIINSPAVFFSSGANAMQINNTGTLNIDRGGKIEK